MMSNSSLVSYTRLSPNYTPRRGKITKVTPHHIAGRISLQTLGNIFAPKSRKASSNYGIDNEGNIGMYVEEKNRAWTSGNAKNDHEAVTIEVANESVGGVWKISDKALVSLILLTEDIHRRNNIGAVNYTGNSRGNLTRHNMFQNTNCPGPYLQSKLPYVAIEVNKRLGKPNKPVAPIVTPARPKANLKVDGYWGSSTTMALQKALGTPQDGVISGQYQNSVTKSLYNVNFNTRNGSNVVRALQRKVGVGADGYLGPATIRGLQRYLSTPQDGVISRPSLMVKEMQKRLNNGIF